MSSRALIARPTHRASPRDPQTGSLPLLLSPSPVRLIHDLLDRAGLRACRVQAGVPGCWSISTIHRNDRGTWSAFETLVHIAQLHEAYGDPDARNRLIWTLARELAPTDNSVS